MNSGIKVSDQTEILTALINLIQLVSEKVYENKMYDPYEKISGLINEKILQREIDKLEFKVQFCEKKIENVEKEIERIKNKLN